MRKLRVDWTDEEDRFLLLSKVAGGFLCQNLHIPMVNHGWVRDQVIEKSIATAFLHLSTQSFFF